MLTSLLFIVFGIVIGLLFYMIISPILAIVFAAQNTQLSGRSKTAWLVGIFVTGPFAAFFYFCRYGQRRFVRILHGLLIGLNGLAIVGCFGGLAIALPYLGGMLLGQKSNPAIQKLDPVNRAKVEIAIDHLSSELRNIHWYEFHKASILIDLNQMLAHDLKDGVFSPPEVDEWLGAVISRGSLDERLFASRIRELKETRAPSSQVDGLFELKYITCQDPSRLTPFGRQTNQSLHSAEFTEKIEITKDQIIFDRTFSHLKNNECNITDSHKLTILGNTWTAEPADAKVASRGSYDPRQCQKQSDPSKEIWVRNHVQSSTLLYLQDSQGQKYCADTSAFFVYDRVIDSKKTSSALPQKPDATLPKSSNSAVATSPVSKEASEKLRAAIEKLKSGDYDQAIALANEAQTQSPNARAPAAVINAAHILKNSPTDQAAKVAAFNGVVKAYLDDFKAVMADLKQKMKGQH
jgi:hypothetical protein